MLPKTCSLVLFTQMFQYLSVPSHMEEDICRDCANLLINFNHNSLLIDALYCKKLVTLLSQSEWLHCSSWSAWTKSQLHHSTHCFSTGFIWNFKTIKQVQMPKNDKVPSCHYQYTCTTSTITPVKWSQTYEYILTINHNKSCLSVVI